MPVARWDVVAVVALAAGVGRVRTVVGEIGDKIFTWAAGAPVVVARDGSRPILDRGVSPRRCRVAVRELRRCSVRVDVVAGREDGTVDLLDDVAGVRVGGDAARGDITHADEDGVGAWGGVEGPGRPGHRAGCAVIDGDVPLECLAGAEVGPRHGVVAAGGDAGVLCDLGVVAARERTAVVGDRQRVAVGVGDVDIEGRRGADPGRRVRGAVQRRRVRRGVTGGRRDEACDPGVAAAGDGAISGGRDRVGDVRAGGLVEAPACDEVGAGGELEVTGRLLSGRRCGRHSRPGLRRGCRRSGRRLRWTS